MAELNGSLKRGMAMDSFDSETIIGGILGILSVPLLWLAAVVFLQIDVFF